MMLKSFHSPVMDMVFHCPVFMPVIWAAIWCYSQLKVMEQIVLSTSNLEIMMPLKFYLYSQINLASIINRKKKWKTGFQKLV